MLFKYYKFLFLSSLLLLNSACFRFVQYEPGDKKSSNTLTKVVTHHRVKAGETLYSIAFEYGRDHRDVARWNTIRRPYTIYPKQKLRIIPISSDSKPNKQKITTKNQRSVVKKSQIADKKSSMLQIQN